MGLFGYNEKDYRKNTDLFKSRLENLMMNTMERGVSNAGVGKCISNLMIMLDKLPYNKGGKELQKVDQEIDKIITAMENDAMKKRMSGVLMRADLLHRELDESRRFGKNAFTDAERQAEGTRADALGHIHDALNRQGEVEKRKKQLIEAAANASESQQQKYRLEYNTLDMESKQLSQTVTMWTSRYNAATKVISARANAGQIGELEAAQVCDIKEFEKEMAQATKKLELQIEKDTGLGDIADGFTSGMDEILGNSVTHSSGFDAAVEDQRKQNLMNEFGSAPESQQSSESSDPFMQAMRNAQNN